MLFDPRADLEIPVGIEELRGHGDQLRDLALVVLELEDLRVALEIVEVVDRANWQLALQVSAHDRDPRLVVRLFEDLVGSALLRGDLEVRRERLDRARSRCCGWGARPWPLQLRGRPRVERARQLVEELPPGRREVALGAEIAPRPAVPGGNALGQIALRVEVEPLRHDAGIGAGSWFRLGA